MIIGVPPIRTEPIAPRSLDSMAFAAGPATAVWTRILERQFYWDGFHARADAKIDRSRSTSGITGLRTF